MVYVVLLRGINVGGNNKVAMSALKQSFEDLGFKQVRTYINSGNVLFVSPTTPDSKKIEAKLQNDFALPLKIVIRSQPELETINKAAADSWVNDNTMKCDVLFLWETVDTKKIMDELIIKPDIDDVAYVKGAVVWRVDRANINKSGLLRIVGTPLYKQMTIRNINTVRKLLSITKTYEQT